MRNLVFSIMILGTLATTESMSPAMGQEKPANVCDVQYSTMWPSEPKEMTKLRNRCNELRQELEGVRDERDDLLAMKNMSNIDGVTVRNICTILRETHVGGRSALANCGNIMTTPLINLVIEVQQLDLSVPDGQRDGWLKSHQWAQLVCQGLGDEKHVYSIAWAAWMFANGQGLPQDKAIGWYLANKAVDTLRLHADPLDDATIGQLEAIRAATNKEKGVVTDMKAARDACSIVTQIRQRVLDTGLPLNTAALPVSGVANLSFEPSARTGRPLEPSKNDVPR